MPEEGIHSAHKLALRMITDPLLIKQKPEVYTSAAHKREDRKETSSFNMRTIFVLNVSRELSIGSCSPPIHAVHPNYHQKQKGTFFQDIA